MKLVIVRNSRKGVHKITQFVCERDFYVLFNVPGKMNLEQQINVVLSIQIALARFPKFEIFLENLSYSIFPFLYIRLVFRMIHLRSLLYEVDRRWPTEPFGQIRGLLHVFSIVFWIRYELISSMEMELLWIYYRSQFSRLPFWSPYIIICIKIMKLLSKTLFAFRIEPECCGSCQRQINKCGKYNCEKYESPTNVNS